MDKKTIFGKCPKVPDAHILPHLLPSVSECKKCQYYKEEYTDTECNLLKATCGISDYVNFGDFCRRELDIQCQYGYHALTGIGGFENNKLGTGLRVIQDEHGGNYHAILIHTSDAEIFKVRYNDWLNRYK
jgi:hypothetical protein